MIKCSCKACGVSCGSKKLLVQSYLKRICIILILNEDGRFVIQGSIRKIEKENYGKEIIVDITEAFRESCRRVISAVARSAAASD